MGERDKIKGMIEAHDMLIAFAKRQPKRKWWQTGARQVAVLEALIGLSDELFAEIKRQGDAAYGLSTTLDKG